MTMESLIRQLEMILGDIGFSGLQGIPLGQLQRLEGLEAWMEELGMGQGVTLSKGFRTSAAAYRRGEGSLQQAADSLCVLSSYTEIVLGNLM